MSQAHSTQINWQDGGDYMRRGDGKEVVAEQFQGYLAGAVLGPVQSPTTAFQANWSFAAQQDDGLSYGQYSSRTGEGPSAVDDGFYPDFVDNSEFDLNMETIHAGGPTSPITSQADRPGPSTPSVLFSPFPSATPQLCNQLIAPPPPEQPQSNGQPAPSARGPTVAVYPHRRKPKVNTDGWTAEQDALLWRRKTGRDPKKKTSWAIADELFDKFKVTRTDNVVTKRWAKLKKQQRMDNIKLTSALNEVASRTAALFQEQLRLVGNVNTQSDNGQMGNAAQNVIQELQAKISRNLQDAAIAWQTTTMSESE